MSLVFTLLFCITLYLSFVGWGSLLAGKRRQVDLSMLGAYGIAVACVLGGVLNWLQLISPVSITVFVAIGLATAIWKLLSNIKSWKRFVRLGALNAILLLALTTLVLLQMAMNSSREQNGHDDNHAYLVFPHQMLQTGHIGDDPYNERRSGVYGGQSFLNAMALTVLPPNQVIAFDGGVAVLALFMLMFGHSIGRGKIVIVFLFVLVACFDPPAVNVSALNSSTVLFYAFLRRFTDNGGGQEGINHNFQFPRELLITATLVAAICSLKASNIPGIAAVGLAAFLANTSLPLKERMIAGAKVAVLSLLLLWPWMDAMHSSSGTYLFPLLGQGTHASWQHGAAPLSIHWSDVDADYVRSILAHPFSSPILLAGMVLIGLALTFRRKLRAPLTPVALWSFLAAVLATLAVSFFSLGVFRYSHAASYAAFVFLLFEMLPKRLPSGDGGAAELGRVPHLTQRAIAVVALAVYAIIAGYQAIPHYKKKWRAMSRSSAGYVVPQMQALATRAQNAVPPGRHIMAVLSHPYLLDFRRNPIVVIDHAGSAGPQGGLPVNRGPRELLDYLRAQGVDYLIYSHGDDANYGPNQVGYRLRWHGTPHRNRHRILAQNNFTFRKRIMDLAQTLPVVHKDDEVLVLKIK